MLAEPDAIVKECMEGSNRKLVEHTQQILEWLDGNISKKPSTVIRQLKHVRSFYAYNFIRLPRVKPHLHRADAKPEKITTATESLSMFRQALSELG
ncbi:MAG: hypothetical protein QXX17_01740 [Conexivisphaerales archaeon]